ncbi:hypothetical protein Ait01nite_046680 [Actinoplanes italicus]|nr:hypothetical protein Ait01nite_046680 [Actinoplanes italicus]
MRPVPTAAPGPENDLGDFLDLFVRRAALVNPPGPAPEAETVTRGRREGWTVVFGDRRVPTTSSRPVQPLAWFRPRQLVQAASASRTKTDPPEGFGSCRTSPWLA